jgi:hypothetical protein
LVLFLGVVTLILAAAVAAYFYGRSQCPPPGWWVRLFVRTGNCGCVAGS